LSFTLLSARLLLICFYTWLLFVLFYILLDSIFLADKTIILFTRAMEYFSAKLSSVFVKRQNTPWLDDQKSSSVAKAIERIFYLSFALLPPLTLPAEK